MTDSLSDQARNILAVAEREARQFHHEYVGTEHILLALVGESGGIAADVLASLGMQADKVRREIGKLVQAGSQTTTLPKTLPLTPRAKQAVAFAGEEVRYWSQDQVEAEHLLVGLAREPDGVAGQVLRNLGLAPRDVARAALKSRIEQMKIVERAVRPIRASTPRKRKMREELLAHLTAIYEQELSRLDDRDAALEAAAQRFGDPAELACELEAALPYHERVGYWMERVFAWRAPESAARYSFRMAMSTFWILLVVLSLTVLGIFLCWGWTKDVQSVARVFLAITLITPPTQFVVGVLQINMRDYLWGVFGKRKSMATALALAGLIAVAVGAACYGMVAIAKGDHDRAYDVLPLIAVVGILFAIVCMMAARFVGPTAIRDTIWALLDVNSVPGTGGRPRGDDPAAEPV